VIIFFGVVDAGDLLFRLITPERFIRIWQRMDRINGLSDDIICHILSLLSFKEATSTSVLSMRWRYLFAFRPNLCLDDQEVGGGDSFIDFVDRVLVVTGIVALWEGFFLLALCLRN
jgi:hypothetical protein